MSRVQEELETVTEESAVGRIFTNHAALRRSMTALVQVAADALHDEKAVARVRSGVEALGAELLAHLDLEERVFLPVLSGIDTAHATRLRAEHLAQRVVVAALLEDARGGIRTTRELVDEVGWFVRCLERDIETEERALLSGDALSASALVAQPAGR